LDFEICWGFLGVRDPEIHALFFCTIKPWFLQGRLAYKKMPTPNGHHKVLDIGRPHGPPKGGAFYYERYP